MAGLVFTFSTGTASSARSTLHPACRNRGFTHHQHILHGLDSRLRRQGRDTQWLCFIIDLFFSCTFVLDTLASFQTRPGYSPGHIFFTVFQENLPFSCIHILICRGFMGQNSGVLARRVHGTVNVVPITCAGLPGGAAERAQRGKKARGGVQGAGSPPNGAISPS